jgi:hypothetical protein
VRINYNDRTDPVMIYIKGNVKPSEATLAASTPPKPVVPAINYGIPRGALAFEKNIENLQTITSDEIREVEFRFKNTSSAPVQILGDKTELQPGLTLQPKDVVLQPGQESAVKIKIDGNVLKASAQADGYFSKAIAFWTDETEGARKQLSINGIFKRVFSEQEKANSPVLTFATTSVEGGKVIEGENYVYDFVFTNTGKAPLKIESAKASCGCTATTPPINEIKPGESAAITASFNSKGRVGTQSKSITVKSNDIENPTVVLKFTVEVVKDPFHAGSMMGGSK